MQLIPNLDEASSVSHVSHCHLQSCCVTSGSTSIGYQSIDCCYRYFTVWWLFAFDLGSVLEGDASSVRDYLCSVNPKRMLQHHRMLRLMNGSNRKAE
jgi:hypothetical protein